MSNCFILLAAGKGKRFKSNTLKQFINYKNKPLFMHSIDKATKSNLFKEIVLVTNSKIKLKNKKVKIIKGGKERYQSSQKGLEYIKNKKFKNVFIHDAARPDFSVNLLKNLKKHLNKNKAVVPFINTDNSTKYKYKSKVINLRRDRLINDRKCFKDEREIQNHIKFIEEEIKRSEKDSRMLELKNWLNYLKAA